MTRPPAVDRLPDGPGVYRFLDERGRVAYLGRATSLRDRVSSYWGSLRDRPHLRRMVAQVEAVQAVPCASVHEATWLERNLLERSKPRWNRVRGGLEVPTWVVLGSGVPALRVVHEGTPQRTGDERHGPYLGGTRSRLAVSGLDRALLLDYADAPAGGFDRDLARVRGLEGDDGRARRVVAGAALRGDPDALALVRDALLARRAAAAAALAFELAGRITEELGALAWVTATQRVTLAGGASARVSGFSAGVLVTFEVREGRVCSWRQRVVGPGDGVGSVSVPADVAAALAATPSGWLPFATAAAELAGALAVGTGAGPASRRLASAATDG
jgi:excinuclease ABC subunit C